MTDQPTDAAATAAPPAGELVVQRVLSQGHAWLYRLPAIADPRGELVPLDFAALPFVPRRAFLVQGTPAGQVRGGHGHAHGQQLLVCVAGRVDVELRHRGASEQVALHAGRDALLVKAGVWARQVYGDGAVLLVLASSAYDPDAYVREHD
jgi:dTDP-4-dehydrorhamnose 3,5-epimerase-like enzyme